MCWLRILFLLVKHTIPFRFNNIGTDALITLRKAEIGYTDDMPAKSMKGVKKVVMKAMHARKAMPRGLKLGSRKLTAAQLLKLQALRSAALKDPKDKDGDATSDASGEKAAKAEHRTATKDKKKGASDDVVTDDGAIVTLDKRALKDNVKMTVKEKLEFLKQRMGQHDTSNLTEERHNLCTCVVKYRPGDAVVVVESEKTQP